MPAPMMTTSADRAMTKLILANVFTNYLHGFYRCGNTLALPLRGMTNLIPGRTVHFGCAGILLSALVSSLVAQTTPPNNFLVHNLVSDLAGTADHQDPNLKNPWGNGFSGGSPFWIGDNGTGLSTLYDGYGVASATVVSIPAAGGATIPGPVTGVIFNAFGSNTAAFNVASGKPASFLFCSLDGVISGWARAVNATQALVAVDNSKSGAVYYGCAQGGTSTAPLLFAANFNSGGIDVFDGNFKPVVNANAFVDAGVPSGFAPFNVEAINGSVYIAYAKQAADKKHYVSGAGNGYVAVFDQSGNLQATLISQGPLNAPWGMAIAPSTFGPFSGALLVGNFGDGTINAFNLTTGKQLGTLDDLKGNSIVLQGLWSLNFGNSSKDPGTLYFTAGIGGGPNNDPMQSHGLLGSIQASPSFLTTGVLNDASLIAGPIAPNTWVAISGAGMSATSGTATATSPTQVNGVGVTVNGEAATLFTVGNTQVTFLVPTDITPGGNAKIQTANNGLTSATVSVPVAALAPAFFIEGTANGVSYIAAEHADGTLVGPTTLVAGKTTPAKAGETIVLFATGFGPANTLAAAPLSPTPVILIDALPAQVVFAGQVAPGVNQFNVVVPQGVRSGDALVVGLISIYETQLGAFISMQ